MSKMNNLIFRQLDYFRKLLIYKKCGVCDVNDINCKLHKSVLLMHKGIGVVISKNAKVGRNVIIYPNVLIGDWGNHSPVIGNNVVIYGNSCIVGKVNIGDCSVIGVNTLVINKDIPSYSTAYNERDLTIDLEK